VDHVLAEHLPHIRWSEGHCVFCSTILVMQRCLNWFSVQSLEVWPAPACVCSCARALMGDLMGHMDLAGRALGDHAPCLHASLHMVWLEAVMEAVMAAVEHSTLHHAFE
jgi:hypothetical protein